MSHISQILTFRTPSHDELFDGVFLPSLIKHEPRVWLENQRLDIEGNGDFLSQGFRRLIMCRLVGLLRVLDRARSGELFVCADVDILILAPFADSLANQMASGDMDILYQAELPNEGINAGLFAFRSVPAVRRFFLDVMEETVLQDHGILEQTAMQNLLPTSGLRYGRLDAALYANGTNGGLGATSVLYHANGTAPRDGKTSLELKRDQFERARAISV